ncbi:hypothetical protein QOZ80_2AG0146540 [Eleusine coracana subsp. coracana]|nr:hypothetical protein QOZ80_2AG0146540 [Eleusine coracana subsp. coracana]
MELFVSTTASARATAPVSFAPLRRGGSPSVVAPLRRRLPARGWRSASAAVPDPVPSEEPASTSSTVVVTDKPDSPADEKVSEESTPSSASVEASVVAPASSSPSEEDGGLDDILSKLDIEVTPTLILTGSGAFVALFILSSVISAIDSIPLLPKLLELVGIGYSVWFIWNYLLFKGNRDELFAKFEDLKQRII